MSPAEQEHLDHIAGSASEFQNCFAEAGMARCRVAGEAREAIDKALAAGRFAVVSTSPYFCRVTDAFVGVIENVGWTIGEGSTRSGGSRGRTSCRSSGKSRTGNPGSLGASGHAPTPLFLAREREWSKE